MFHAPMKRKRNGKNNLSEEEQKTSKSKFPNKKNSQKKRKWEEIERNALKRNTELREQDEKDNYEQYNELTKW